MFVTTVDMKTETKVTRELTEDPIIPLLNRLSNKLMFFLEGYSTFSLSSELFQMHRYLKEKRNVENPIKKTYLNRNYFQ